MAIQTFMKVLSNKELIKDVFEMVVEGDTSAITTPGQFVNLKLNKYQEPYLRRPMSICDYDDHTLTMIYKVVGTGTKLLSEIRPGHKIDMLTGLGHGFVYQNEKSALLIGGGLGLPPLYKLAKELLKKGVDVKLVVGFASKKDAFYLDEFKELCPVFVATMDGTLGTKGTVIDAIKENNLSYEHYYACGPLPMLKALAKFDDQHGSLSYEARMGCGFGACMGCSMEMKDGSSKRVCYEGPVFASSEVKIDG